MGGNAKGWLAGLILAASVSLAGVVFAQEPAPDSRVLSNGSQQPAAPGGAAKDAKPAAPDQAQGAKTADKKPAVQDKEAVTPPEPPKAKLDEKKKSSAPAAAAPAAAAAAAAAGDAGAAEGSAASSFLTPSVPSFGADGALRYEYAIDMPEFRGLEPAISLNYDSGRKTKTGGTYQGWLGFGWGMDGFDVIERGRPRGGVPAFDGNDVYSLNGGELVPCTTGMDSPSCRYGGNYTTEVESYQRVKFDSASNIWTVTGKDGTVSVFLPIAALASPAGADAYLAYSSRWLLKYTVDVHGNQVNYTYNCPSIPVCYPSTISYGLYQATFYLEARPDHILMANGRNISDTAFRVKNIRVTANNATVSAYALTYAQAPSSGTTRLVSVQRFGTDAILSAAGVVTGSALPPVVFAYRDLNTQYSLKELNVSSTTCSWASRMYPFDIFLPAIRFIDLDNNGIDELFMNCLNSYYLRLIYDKIDFVRDTISETYSIAENYTAAFGTSVNSIGLFGNFADFKLRKSLLIWDSLSSPYTDIYGDDFPIHSYYVYTTQFDTNIQSQTMICDENSIYARDCKAGYDKGDLTSVEDIQGISRVAAVPSNEGGAYIGDGQFTGDGTTQTFHHDIYRAVWWRSVSNIGVPVANSPKIPFSENGKLYLTDLNGDGLTDIVSKSTLATSTNFSFKIWLCTGSGFLQQSSSAGGLLISTATAAWDTNSRVNFADMDGDGRDEIVIRSTKTAGNALLYMVSLGFGSSGVSTLLSAPPSLLSYSFGSSDYVASGDVNGDGLPDFLAKPSSQLGRNFLLSNGAEGLPNSLLSIKNELGGVDSFKFTPSTRWINTYLPMAMSTLTEIKTDDGRGLLATQKIAYAGGKYDPAMRRFFGFRTVTELKPCLISESQCPSVETTYRQDVASAGAVERQVSKDGAGTAHRQVDETYAIRSDLKPYRAQNIATVTTLTENTTAALRVDRLFDEFGNVYDTKDQGRTDISGDELWATSWVYPNTTAYIVDKPSYASVRGDFDAASPQLKLSYFYYDYQVFGTGPARGDLTRQIDYQNVTAPPHTYLSTSFEYDAYGNRTAETDYYGARTERTFDSTFRLFPVSERDALYATDSRHQATALYNPLCAAPSEKTGIDGVRVTFEYDAFCRQSKQTNTATGALALTYYWGLGNPLGQYAVSYTSGPNLTKSSAAFFDGLGRTYLERMSGDLTSDAATDINVYSAYDTRGNLRARSLPYTGATATQYITTGYDWADRVVSLTQPDGATRTFTHYLMTGCFGNSNPGLSYLIQTDELGRKTHVWRSTRGDIISVSRQLGASWQYETRRYDALGRMTSLTDALGAWWYNFYDMQGNRLSASDPDLGTWTYTYDANNRLTSQTDARGVKTLMNYDALGRLLNRWVFGTGEVLATNVYDEARQYFTMSAG